MYQARVQLRKSQELREGKNIHQGGLRSGQDFAKSLRRQQQNQVLELDEDYLREYDERWINNQRQAYLGEKYMEFAEQVQEESPLPRIRPSRVTSPSPSSLYVFASESKSRSSCR